MALIITLSLIVLVTVAAMAFFTRATSNTVVETSRANQTLAKQVADTATDYINGSFLREIVSTSVRYGSDGLTNVLSTNATATNPPYVYQTFTNAFAAPQRPAYPNIAATPENFFNLIRMSVSNSVNGIGETNASTHGTATPSRNGRSLSTNRWNAPMLLTGEGFTSTNQLPNWIYLLKDGSVTNTPSVANSPQIIGRFAYVTYDEGGLLNANVAGYPSVLTNAITNLYAIKGTLAGADLTQLTSSVTQSAVDDLITFRNPQASASAAAYTNYVLDAAKTGFLNTVTTNSATGGTTNRFFATRQDLIRYAKTQNTPLINALPYLTHYSRALEQPSYCPDPSRPLIINSAYQPTNQYSYYGNNDGAGGDNTINPSFLNVRVSGEFTRANGTRAVVGEPLVKTRFPLGRLTNITTSATNTSPLIYKYFGLTQSNTTSPWVYNHGITNGGQPIIGTLEKVAAANREPDFAELLKAAISAGSLGKAGPNIPPGYLDGVNAQFPLECAIDYQVLQIMANLIDQYDTDSLPTIIRISSAAGIREFRGVEDLPYFYRFDWFSVVTRLPNPVIPMTVPITWVTTNTATFDDGSTNCPTVTMIKPAAPADLTDPGEAAMLIAPEVWNPHDPNTTLTAKSGRPSSFRIVTDTDIINPDGTGTVPWKIGTKSGLWINELNKQDKVISTANLPKSPTAAISWTNSGLTFSDAAGTLFREPTLLWRPNIPTGSSLSSEYPTNTVTDVTSSQPSGPAIQYTGVVVGRTPISTVVRVPLPGSSSGVPYPANSIFMIQTKKTGWNYDLPVGASRQLTFRLQYLNSASQWVTYDQKSVGLEGLAGLNSITTVNWMDYPYEAHKNPFYTPTAMSAGSAPQFSQWRGTSYDPRTARFGMGTQGYQNGPQSQGAFKEDNPYLNNSFLLEPNAYNNYAGGSFPNNQGVQASLFSIMATQRPDAKRGNQTLYNTPGFLKIGSVAGIRQFRFFSGDDFYASSPAPMGASVYEFDGLWSQNIPGITMVSRNGGTTTNKFYYEDADGVARRAMGAYADYIDADAIARHYDGSSAGGSATLEGLPLATANSYAAGTGNYGVGSPMVQSQSRPLILNRPFRSVSEMSYAFKGSLWKNIDFFTPESGDSALLDVFCLNEPPASGLVAGKVNLNSRQLPVLSAMLSGSYRDTLKSLAGAPGYALAPLSTAEITKAAQALVTITTNSINPCRGALKNVSELVGRYVQSPGAYTNTSDVYNYMRPVEGSSVTYQGYSAALDTNVYTAGSAAARIQRMREAAIRPLADSGQTRVWNLMSDVVAQSGRFISTNSVGAGDFSVSGEKNYWIHAAIDRPSAKVIDQQIEEYSQ